MFTVYYLYNKRMSHINNKNNLQDYCQKNKLPLPQYNTQKIESDNNIGSFRAIINIFDKEFIAFGNSKKDAEKNVAGSVLAFMGGGVSRPSSPKIRRVPKVKFIEIMNYIRPTTTILLVDAENSDIDIDILKENIVALFFVAKNTTKNKVFELQEKYHNCFVFISDSIGRDAADHLMTFHAGQLSLINQHGKNSYYVLTKDHFGEFFEKLMPNCKLICSTDEMVF